MADFGIFTAGLPLYVDEGKITAGVEDFVELSLICLKREEKDFFEEGDGVSVGDGGEAGPLGGPEPFTPVAETKNPRGTTCGAWPSKLHRRYTTTGRSL